MNLIDNIDFALVPGGYFPKMGRWHIFSDEEHALALNADNNFEGKIRYVDFYKRDNEEYYYNGLKLIEKIFRRFNIVGGVSEDNPIVIDMIYSLHRFGCSYEEYFWYDFQHLNFEGRNQYITDKIRYYLYNKLNLEENHLLFRNKLSTYEVFKKYYGREVIGIKSDDDFDQFCDFCKRVERFIVKKIDGDCGKGAKIYRGIATDIENIRKVFNDIRSGGDAVIEELIVQTSDLAKFHPQSVNTVRLITVACKDSVRIFHPFFRMGSGDTFVDNAGAGGIFAAIDPDTGICYTSGVDENGNHHLIHPDTKVKIVGTTIPRWDEAKALVTDMAQLTSSRYVGWDLALTDNGWVLVEGNSCGQFVMQVADKTGRLKEILEMIDCI